MRLKLEARAEPSRLMGYLSPLFAAVLTVIAGFILFSALGKNPLEAIYSGCTLRFRPIMMTTVAALFGTMPIALGYGAGAELRQPLGVAVVGGLVVSQLLTLYTIPVTYLYMDRFSEWISGVSRRRRPDGIARDHALVPANRFPPPARLYHDAAE